MDVPRPRRQRQRDAPDAGRELLHRPTLSLPSYEHMFYPGAMRVEYRIEPCRSALTQVKGMPFRWSLNPYMGCAHRCTFCYVRHFEQRADRPADDRYGRSIRVKPNVAEVLRRELARPSWGRDEVALGTATDPYQPAEGRFRLTRACLEELDAAWTPYSIVTRGPLVVRDIDVLQQASARAGARGLLLAPHARRACLADDRAGNRTSREPARGDSATRCGGRRGRRRDRPDPARALRRSATTRGGRPRGTSGGRTWNLGERGAPAAGRARALPRGARARLARGGRALRGAVRHACIPERGDDEADSRAGVAGDRLGAEPDAAAPTGVGTASARARSLTPPAGTRRSAP